MSDDERLLVQRAIGYDSRAFTLLYDRYVDKIYRYIHYKVGTSAQAEDLTAQVFLKAWENIGKYRWTERPFSAWLYRIAHNAVVDHFRTHRATELLEDVPLEDERAASLDDLAEQRLTRERVKQAIAQLTDEQQEVIILKFLEGYSTAEVARLIGKEQGAVRALQHRALDTLQRIFRQEAQP
jgi:RNA polymerase sigma-70 factor (ECF subfamily)